MTETTDLELLNDVEPAPQGRGISLASIVLIAGVLIAAAVFGLALSRQKQTQPTHGTAPDFTVTTFDGETIRLADLRGKVVVMNFWASWCVPCAEEAPLLQSIWEDYEGQDVVFLGIAYVDTEPQSRAFIAEYGITYPNAPDVGTRISDAYNIKGVPETFVIDKEGNIVQFIYAAVAEAEPDELPNVEDIRVTDIELRQTIDRLLQAA